MKRRSTLRITDSYKPSHWMQLPKGSKKIYSYFESRLPGAQIPFFGLQYILKEFFVDGFTEGDCIDMYDMFSKHVAPNIFNAEGFLNMWQKYEGKFPLEVKAVPEGTIVDGGNIILSVENTDEEFPWLGNYFDPLFTQLWFPCTIAAKSYESKRVLMRYAEETADDTNVLFKLHDFALRGSPAVEAAAIGGAAHLLSFMGTDNIPALTLLQDYYHEEMAGFSIPASEHSTITSWGRDSEYESYRNMLRKFPTGLVAVVSDSYDIFNATETIWGTQLHDMVMAREGTLVIRPDSGDPMVVIPRLLHTLADKFGAKANSKGYWVLDPHVRLIQGDGINLESMTAILEAMKNDGWSMENIAFGSGGGLLQKYDRDTYRFAFKASYIETDYGNRDVYKEPITDIGKTSKRGRMALIQTSSGRWESLPQGQELPGTDHLRTVFKNGELLIDEDFATIRKRMA